MSLFPTRVSQIWPRKGPTEKSQFRGRHRGFHFRLVSRLSSVAKRHDAPYNAHRGSGIGKNMHAILVCLLLCGAFAMPAAAADRADEMVAHGKALVDAGDCASCHTLDPAKPLAGGKRIDTPFGAIYSPNLTPDKNTGLGFWRDQDFIDALRYGIAPDGSNYYPAFPYPNFTKLTRDDMLAIRAYHATLEPYANTAPKPELR